MASSWKNYVKKHKRQLILQQQNTQKKPLEQFAFVVTSSRTGFFGSCDCIRNWAGASQVALCNLSSLYSTKETTLWLILFALAKHTQKYIAY